MFDNDGPAELLERIADAVRAENAAAARRFAAIGALYALRLAEHGEEPDWAVDTWAAVSSELSAALGISAGMAGSSLSTAVALRERLPKLAAAFARGEVDQRTVRTIVYRTGLVTDVEAIAVLDAQLAARAGRWPAMAEGRLAREVDRLVARRDPDAVRRVRERVRGRDVVFWDAGEGFTDVAGRLFATDAKVIETRLNEIAGSVCERDPRGVDERRAEALTALATGADRLGCRCGREDCAATALPPLPASKVVVHVVAERGSVAGTGAAPGVIIGSDGLIPAEVLAEIARAATLVPLFDAGNAAPESHYTPSKKLADWVRCRDLTCRFPGCDQPATDCDADHTVPYGQGGRTHASNLKCLCRHHHLLKTFRGWRDEQLRDGTVIWTSPAGQRYVTTPGSALLFPALAVPTADMPPPPSSGPAGGARCQTAAMPLRRRSRAQAGAQAIDAERRQNRQERAVRRAARMSAGALPDALGGDPPPF
ncbi:HNH endonuclease [Mycobacterium sp. MYCO198283]|uniref:HNH endonuclease signature motif containing protein n=1 Tax=Mycobacterium sp. MYCO198283 TaxID=2883505 RepID=UPI001E615A5B|nr:HNH endonuclease signature motif containing protein [Mycobacterium sp. MYCO198283]MCG5430795.1 HNH endonuclease [Mycobacterium sp. MYCO198283]